MSASRCEFQYELLFSDDGSSDGCGKIVEDTVKSLNLSNGCVKVVRSVKNFGKGHAVRLAVGEATGDIILYTDCDLAYGTDVITEAFLMCSAKDFSGDILIGSRNLTADGYEGYSLIRKIASKCYIKLICAAAGFKLTDSQCGFKAFRRDCAKKLFSLAEIDGWAFDLELLMLAQKFGYKIKEFPVKIINHRESKIHLAGDSIKMLKDVRRIKKRISSQE